MRWMKALLNTRMLVVFLMGFSSGLPLLLIGSTLSAWCTESGLNLSTIGLFSLVTLPYSWKFVWAPLLDRYVPPFYGRRRGWLLITQIGLIAGFLAMSVADPANAPWTLAAIALVVAILSATQDIALDAYRREYLSEDEFAFGNSLAITGYRIGMLVAGSLGLILADHIPWSVVYIFMAGCMLIGLITTMLAREPEVEISAPQSVREAFTGPFFEFFRRPDAIWLLAFIVLYKIGDNMASSMTTPFYLKIGFTKSEIGTVVKAFGIWATIGGGLIGGATILRIGLYRALLLFGILQGAGNMIFAWLATVGAQVSALATAVTLENLAFGMGSAALVAFMASLTNKRFTATQYALFSSLMSVPRTITGVPSGYIAEHTTWPMFFTICTLCSIPGLFVLMKIKSHIHHLDSHSER